MLASIPFPSWIRPEIIPGLPIRGYGLMYLVAFVVTYLMFMLQVKQRGLAVKRDQVLDMFFWAIIGLLVEEPGRRRSRSTIPAGTTSVIPCRSSCRSRWSTAASG